MEEIISRDEINLLAEMFQEGAIIDFRDKQGLLDLLDAFQLNMEAHPNIQAFVKLQLAKAHGENNRFTTTI